MSTGQQETPAFVSIDAGTNIGGATLRVSNLARSREFYEGLLCFRALEESTGRVLLGTQANEPLLELIEVAGAGRQPGWATGLYHIAFLFPTRADLGREIARLIQARWEIGQGDHIVSEALYISDPDGNGLELYRDRPRSTWKWSNGQVVMGTGPVDIRGMLADAEREAEPWDVIPAGTRIGHMHLQIGDIAEGRRFYHTILGFDVVAEMPTALFVSAGGYHHQIGMNTWQSLGAPPTPSDRVGLQRFVIALPTVEALQAVKVRLLVNEVKFEAQGEELVLLEDPWQNALELKVQSTPPISM